VFVSANSDTDGALTQTLASRVVEHFYATPAPEPPSGSRALIDRKKAFEGAYRSNRRAYHGLEGFVERLGTLAQLSVTDEGRLRIEAGRRITSFTPDGDPLKGVFIDGDGARGATFAILGGKAARFMPPSGGETFDRVAWWDENRTMLAGTVATTLSALLTLLGVILRDRREFRESSSQSRAGFLQTTQSVLWLAGLGLFAAWSLADRDPASRMYHWPGLPLILASSSALVASVMALLSLALLPAVWRGGRRLDSWSGLRKLQYTLTALIFLSYGILLGLWGALEPWSA
jgi:hypothetical protein